MDSLETFDIENDHERLESAFTSAGTGSRFSILSRILLCVIVPALFGMWFLSTMGQEKIDAVITRGKVSETSLLLKERVDLVENLRHIWRAEAAALASVDEE